MAGHDGCGNFMGILITLAFVSHGLGILSPFWYCSGDNCMRGLYYTCSVSEIKCHGDVPSPVLLVLALIVLVSSFILMLAICYMLHCCYFKYYNIKRSYGIALCLWFIAQECLSVAILVRAHVTFSRVGWATYTFTVPGVVFMFIMAGILLLKYCWPKKTTTIEVTNA